MIEENKENIISNSNSKAFKFDKLEIPELKETKSYNGSYYLTNSQDKWFEELLDLYNNSSLHSAIINNLHHRIVKNTNNELLSKIALDYLIFGGYSIKVNWDLLHNKILSLSHVDFSKIRTGLFDENDEPTFYYFSPNWHKYNNKKITTFQAYNVDKSTDDCQIFVYNRYTAGTEIYPKPYYISGLEWIYTDRQLKKYYSNLVKNNFVANTLLTMPVFQDQEKEEHFEREVKKNFTGDDNAGSIFVVYTENSTDNGPVIQRFNNDADDTRYQYITNKVIEEITLTHNIPIALLISVPGKLSNASDLEIYDKIYEEYMVAPIQNELMKGFNELQSNMMIKNNIV